MNQRKIVNFMAIKKHDRRLLIKVFSLVTLAMFIIVSLYVYLNFRHNVSMVRNKATLALENESELLNTQFSHIKDNLDFVKEYTKTILKINSKDTLFYMNDFFYNFVKTHPNILQLRFLNLEGVEVARVDGLGANTAVIKTLQDKSHRYYYRNAKNLKENEVYVSPIDLNIEHNTIEVPYKPVIRFTEPLFLEGKKVGYIIINFCAKELLKKIKDINEYIDIVMLNSDSYYLIGFERDKEFGFMFDDKKEIKLSKDHPALWNFIMQAPGKHQTLYNENVYISTFDPAIAIGSTGTINQNGLWYVLAFYDNTAIWNQTFQKLSSNAILVLPLVMVVIVLSYLLYSALLINNEKDSFLIQQSRFAAMGEMLSMIAHQWRQPIGAISSAAINVNLKKELNVLSDDILEEQMQFIQTQCQQMSGTINDFMDFFKPNRVQETFALVSCIKIVEKMVLPQLQNRSIKLHTAIDEDVSLYGVKNEFEHVLLNLIANAKDAFKNIEHPEKNIEVSASTFHKGVRVIVSDNAGGIPDAIIHKIFDPYFTTKHASQGTGIGLYMTRTIIERHFKGSISVRNVGKGTEFTIFVPFQKHVR